MRCLDMRKPSSVNKGSRPVTAAIISAAAASGYNGARGSYAAEQDIFGFGGKGTAKFSLTLTTED